MNMNDKEKQIEEMAKVVSVNCGECYTCEFNTMPNCIDYLVANELYNAGYRKIDKGSVVLTEEEYEALRLIEKYHIKSCGKNSVVLTTEELEEIRKQAVKELIQAITQDVGTIYRTATSTYVDIDDIHHIAIDKFGVKL